MKTFMILVFIPGYPVLCPHETLHDFGIYPRIPGTLSSWNPSWFWFLSQVLCPHKTLHDFGFHPSRHGTQSSLLSSQESNHRIQTSTRIYLSSVLPQHANLLVQSCLVYPARLFNKCKLAKSVCLSAINRTHFDFFMVLSQTPDLPIKPNITLQGSIKHIYIFTCLHQTHFNLYMLT